MVRAWVIALGFMLVLAGQSLASAAVAPAEVVCPLVSAPPVLDGRLDDWAALPQAALASKEAWRPTAQQFAEYGGTGDIAADLWAAWDGKAFYLAVQVRDDQLVRPRSIAEINRGDSVVLTFAGREAQEVNEFVVASLKNGYPVYRAKPASRTGEVRTINVGIGAPRQDNGVQVIAYEVEIPWAELAPLRPGTGERFGFVVSVCDDDGAGLKGCMEQSLSLVLSETGIEPPPPPPPPPVQPVGPPVLPPAFAAPGVVRYDTHCFTLRGQDVVLFGGEVDYAHLPAESWAARLSALKSAGMNLVGVTVPWSYHEPAPGQTDLTSLNEFLSLCGREGLWVQVTIGPFAGETQEGGGVPGWVMAIESPEGRWAAVESWFQEVLAVAKQHQITAGGTVVSVVVRPLAQGGTGGLSRLAGLVSKSGVQTPVLTANSPGARDNTRQAMASILDTIGFYSPPDALDLISGVEALGKEENGPPVVAVFPGNYDGQDQGRGAANCIKLALSAGAREVLVGDFAPGLDAGQPVPGEPVGRGVIQVSGARSAGHGEMELIGSFLRQFGARLARAERSVDAVTSDDAAVKASAYVTDRESFLFVANQDGGISRHVRLTFKNLATGEELLVPEAGALTVPAGDVKALVTNVPVGRGVLRYATSEVLAIGKVGERTVLVVYGDADTVGEVSLQWPGPPLVTGEVARQAWDAGKKTLTLDYFHAEEARCILVDELEIVVLSRTQAREAAVVSGAEGGVVLIPGAELGGAARWPDKLEAALDCHEGETQVSALAPDRPSAVLVDGTAVDFAFTAPERMVKLSISTDAFEKERGAGNVWEQIGRAIEGGPPALRADFDRGWFMPEELVGGEWRPLDPLARSTEELGLPSGSFLRLRARFDPEGRTRMAVRRSGDPLLVFIGGRFVPELSGNAGESETEVGSYLVPGENEVIVILHLLPHGKGQEGMAEERHGLPEIKLLGAEADLRVDNWQISKGLAGLAAGWTGQELDVSAWHFIRFGPWQEQGRELAAHAGVGWYRVLFGLPHPRQWQIPYQVKVTLAGSATLYLNGHPLANCAGDGTYVIPLPAEWLTTEKENALAAVVYGSDNSVGLRRVEVATDRAHMTKRRTLEIRF